MNKIKKGSKKIAVGATGGIILLLGIAMIPYPGPGWLVVFIGLSILATEFQWARSVHDYAHSKYDAWQTWLRDQPWSVRMLFWIITTIVVIVTIWLLNGYGMVNSWFQLGLGWLDSPLLTPN